MLNSLRKLASSAFGLLGQSAKFVATISAVTVGLAFGSQLVLKYASSPSAPTPEVEVSEPSPEATSAHRGPASLRGGVFRDSPYSAASPREENTPSSFPETRADAPAEIQPDSAAFASVTGPAPPPRSSAKTSSPTSTSSEKTTDSSNSSNEVTVTSNVLSESTATSTSTATTSLSSVSWSFLDATDYVFDTSLLRVGSGKAERRSVDEIRQDATEFVLGTHSGTTVTSSRLTIDPINGAQTSLSSSWTPQWARVQAYWKFEGNGNDELNLYNATLTGTPLNAFGFIGSGSLHGDTGNTQYAITTASPAFNGSFSLSMWVRSEVDPSSQVLMYPVTVLNNANERAIAFVAGGNFWSNSLGMVICDRNGDNCNTHYALYQSPTGLFGKEVTFEWVHLAFTYNPTASPKVAVYKNGVAYSTTQTLAGAGTGIVGATAAKIRIGGRPDCCRFQGELDEVAFWDTTLTAAEVEKIYSRQSAKYTGVYISKTVGLGTAVSWPGLWAATPLPFSKEIPLSESTSAYSEQPASLLSDIAGLWHLDESAATAGATNDFADSSGVGPSGEASTGGIIYAVGGRFGKAVAMDGVNDGIIFGNVLNMGTSDFTLSAWVNSRSAANGNNNGIIYKKTTAGVADAGYRLSMPDGQFSFRLGNGTSGLQLDTVGTKRNNGKWHHVVAVRRAGTMEIYVDGALNNSRVESLGNIDTATVLAFGGLSTNGTSVTNHPFSGSLDEVGIWKRALKNGSGGTENEILALYRRGANRIKYQVRTCDDENCDTETWRGPNGTSSTFFSELHNHAAISTAGEGTGAVGNGALALQFTSFATAGLALATNSYFQYRAWLESDDTQNLCSGAACQPAIDSVSLDSSDRYRAEEASISNKSGISYSSLSALALSSASSCSLRYQLSRDGTNFYYWNGAGWAKSTSSAHSNLAADAIAQVSSFSSQGGSGSFYFKAYFPSDTQQACELYSIGLTYY